MLKILFPISDFLYILQLEEYDTNRYLKRLKHFFWKRNIQKRDKLVWTKRIKITAAIALPLCIFIFPLTPIWIGLVNWLLTPYFEKIKLSIQKKALKYFAKENKKTKVIAVAGSFGKTTTKNYIYELVRFNYKTQMIPGNINTPTGIANWILQNFDPTSDLLIVEVDTYYIGEIKHSLSITPPDIAILTNIGDQHLERFGTKKNLARALNEVFDYAKPDAIKLKNKKTNLEYALEIARLLNIPKDIISDTVKKLSKPDRRGDIKIINNFEVVDESYNISETTAKSAIDNALVLAGAKHKKLVVITAGIPELGEENKNANKSLGYYLVKNADKVIILKSILHKEVLNDFDKFTAKQQARLILADNLNAAWKILEGFDPKKYLILLQPELNDLYY